MKTLLKINEFQNAGKEQVGGKAHSLAAIGRQGLRIPETFCIPSGVYEAYLIETGLKDKIWDIALRIRHFFLTTPIPENIQSDLERCIRIYC